MENLADSYDGYRFSTIAGLTGSPSGDLFIGSPNSATVYRHDPTLGKLFVLNEDLVRSNDLLIDSTGSRLLVAESGPNRVVVYDLNCSGGLSRSWNLVKFPKGQAKPLSIDFLNNEENLLVVLLDRGKKLQILDLRAWKTYTEHSTTFSLPKNSFPWSVDLYANKKRNSPDKNPHGSACPLTFISRIWKFGILKPRINLTGVLNNQQRVGITCF